MIEEDKYLIEQCKQRIEKALGWGTSDQWTSQDFLRLSEHIFAKTRISLSVSTLKRIWGRVRYDSLPNTTTLDTLAQLLDFENWRAFKRDVLQEKEGVNQLLPTPENNPVPSHTSPIRRRYSSMSLAGGIFLAIIISILGMGMLLNRKTAKPLPAGPVTVSFKSRQVSDDLPNSVVFDYAVAGSQSDSAMIQQSWDPKRREKVSLRHQQHTSVYYYPGFFRAKLLVDGKIRREDDVFIRTKGWKGIIDQEPMPIYLRSTDIRHPGCLSVSSDVLRQKTGMTVFNERGVDFFNVRDFGGLASDAFTFETKLRNTASVEESICRRVWVYVLGTRGAIILPLGDKGCSATLNLWTGDQEISGKQHDLSAFGCDFSRPQTLKCAVRDGQMQISLNAQLVYQVPVKKDIGNVIGLRYGFEGTGAIYSVKLQRGDGETVFEEKF